MDKITNAAELREAKQKRKEIADKLSSLNKPDMTEEEARSWETLKADFDDINAKIVAYESYQERSAVVKDYEQRQKPAQGGSENRVYAEPRSRENLHVYNNLGEQLVAVRNAAFGQHDERLTQLNNEARALGSQESVGADGGFAVQTDFAGSMMDSAAQEGDILPRVDTYEVGAQSNSAKWTVIDETDVSETVFGGVQVYWASEAGTVAASKPKTRELKLDLEKLMGFAYATEELLQDTTFMSTLYNRAFSKSMRRTLEGDIVDGDGVGKPLGIKHSGALITVPKESGQAAQTVQYENIVHMWGRLHPDYRPNAIWLMHPDLEEVLPFMNFPIGTGGVPVFMPPTGVAGSQHSTLYGKPIIPSDHCSALGQAGDVILGDLDEYVLIKKGGMQSAVSIHVAFLTAENCFRFIFRVNGTTKAEQPLKIKNSDKLRSSFVTLAERA